jgi:hydrogenase nickel incorporation protein HypB
MFRAADLVALTKVDLLTVLDDFSTDRALSNVRALANAAPVLELSVKRDETMESWLAWLDQEVQQHRRRLQSGETVRPRIQPDGARLHALAT